MRTLLIDNHDSYTYNLFHLLAEVNGRDPEVVAHDAAEVGDLRLEEFDAIVLSPGAGDPRRPRDFGLCRDVLCKAELPILGVCLGHQGIAVSEGAEVVRAPQARHGFRSRIEHRGDPLFAGMPAEFAAVRYHSLCVAEPLPSQLEPLAWAEDGVLMALRHRSLPRWGVQFHPESVATELGARLLGNFRDLVRPASRPPAPARAAARRAEPEVEYRAHVRELPAVDAEAAFAALFAASPDAFWLDSAQVVPGTSRFSFLGDGSGPLAETVRHRTGDEPSIFDRLDAELARRRVRAPELPFDFVGGYVGYFGYELKAECGGDARHRAGTPDACWLFADRFLAVDHELGRTHLVALSADAGTERAARRWLADATAALERLPALPDPLAGHRGVADVQPLLERSRDDYLRAVAACREQLLAGESYEICLTTGAALPAADGAFETYRRLRALNPAPYGAFLRCGDVEVACSSPERFLKISGGTAEAKPIKGTAPRGDTPERDAELRDGLAADPKSRAENLMIVDLLRNDLGRVCAPGSVHVPVLMDVESYRTVHQLVSTVRGELREGSGAVDCVRACFPAGSMTGAPKRRTMEIIDELEDRARGVYSGALGYLSLTGDADLSVVIRTAVRSGGGWRIGAGGAVVLDSDPEAEHAEMLLKATAAARCLPEP
ncbi:aminodeoxychorismate synthase component I [Saccharopolyspora gregorii]|uniref:aminodeoxychorismate synthase component I n=1 Tax=Saccharopolyspora gregorii TaxID=33914 RepID=UPI0021AC9BA5|nr:aminodeoxychorismate synthase component I [Saccharopolyspora gregorii]